MKPHSDGAILAATVAARIREFRAARGISAETLVNAANLSPGELHLLELESKDMTQDMLNRIAAVFGVHPAVLCMSPDEHAIAMLLEAHRDLPKDEFQKLAGELVSKGFSSSKGIA